MSLATTILDTIVPSAGFPAVATRTAVLNSAAGAIFFAFTRRRCCCTKRYCTESKTKTDTQVVRAIIMAIPVVRPAIVLCDFVAGVSPGEVSRCLAEGFRLYDFCRYRL